MQKIFFILFLFASICQADEIRRYQATDGQWHDIGSLTSYPHGYDISIYPSSSVTAQLPSGVLQLSIMLNGNFTAVDWTDVLLMDNYFEGTNFHGSNFTNTWLWGNYISDTKFTGIDLSTAYFENNWYYEGHAPLFPKNFSYDSWQIAEIPGGGGTGPTIPEPAALMIGIIAAFALFRRLDKKK